MATDRPRNVVDAALGAIRDQLGELQDFVEARISEETNHGLLEDLSRIAGAIDVTRDAVVSAWATAYACLPPGYMVPKVVADH